MYFYIVAHVNLLAVHMCDSVMANSDSDQYDSDVKLKIDTAYVQKYYMKCPMCTSILSGRSYIQEVLEGKTFSSTCVMS